MQNPVTVEYVRFYFSSRNVASTIAKKNTKNYLSHNPRVFRRFNSRGRPFHLRDLFFSFFRVSCDRQSVRQLILRCNWIYSTRLYAMRGFPAIAECNGEDAEVSLPKKRRSICALGGWFFSHGKTLPCIMHPFISSTSGFFPTLPFFPGQAQLLYP